MLFVHKPYLYEQTCAHILCFFRNKYNFSNNDNIVFVDNLLIIW